MNRLLIGGIALAALIGGPARAADMRPPPAPVTFFTWTGAYVGVNLGGGWRQPVDFVTTVAPCTDPLTCLLFAEETGVISGLGTRSGTRGKGITGGFQIGYNYQAGPVVVGVEADWEYFKRNSFLAGTAPRTFDFGLMTVTNDASSTWLATVRGRLGLAWDRFLVYATGGVAFTDLRYIQTLTATGAVFGSASAIAEITQTQTGPAVGGGAEYALWNNLSVRAEYLYAEFGDVSRGSFPIVSGTAFSNTFTGSTGKLHDHIVRIGLNYKFGYGAEVASY